MAAIHEMAHAKINLALHVTGQRADGYHLLDTLVAFTEAGDRLAASAADTDEFTLSGLFSETLAACSGPGTNLVLKARDLLRQWLISAGRHAPPVHLHLEKNLPVSAGIGGGSADAAATLRSLMRLWDATVPADALEAIALALGADVPMCLVSRPLVARGIGERITQACIAPMPILLVNPLVPISTPDVFRLLSAKDNPPLPGEWTDACPPDIAPARLAPLRNDLQPPAQALEPVIGTLCTELRQAGASLARMSGSGATCFGLFADDGARDRAAQRIRSAHPAWFVAATRTLT